MGGVNPANRKLGIRPVRHSWWDVALACLAGYRSAIVDGNPHKINERVRELKAFRGE